MSWSNSEVDMSHKHCILLLYLVGNFGDCKTSLLELDDKWIFVSPHGTWQIKTLKRYKFIVYACRQIYRLVKITKRIIWKVNTCIDCSQGNTDYNKKVIHSENRIFWNKKNQDKFNIVFSFHISWGKGWSF